ncbi:MAG: hypothetical protein QM775_15945 [Pirellulales bacterium]
MQAMKNYNRRGLATLELALSFPILILMVALIMLTADGMVLTSQTQIDARTNAMNRSLAHKSAGGMDRFLLEDVATSSRYTRDIVTGSASRTDTAVTVFPSGQISGSAQLSVLRNTWSYTELPLKDKNRLELYGQLVLAGSLGKMTSVIDQLRGLGSAVGDTMDRLGDASRKTQEDPPGLDEARKKQEEARAKREAEKKRIEGEVQRLQGEIAQINQEITQLNKDKEQAEKDLKDKPEEARGQEERDRPADQGEGSGAKAKRSGTRTTPRRARPHQEVGEVLVFVRIGARSFDEVPLRYSNMTSAEPIPSLPEPSAQRRAVQMAVRLALAAGVLAVGYWTITRFTNLLHDREPVAVVKPTDSADPTTTEPAPLNSVALSQLGGSWEFLGAGWSLTVGTATDKEKALIKAPAVDPNVELPAEIDSIERSLGSLFESLHAAQTKVNGWATRSVANDRMLATAQERFDGQSYRIVMAHGVLRLGPDQWATIAAVRAKERTSDTPSSGLLPSVAGLERLAVRRGPGGAVVGEFSKAASKIDQLLELWRAAGVPVTLNDGVADTREGIAVVSGRPLRLILWEPGSRGDTTILALDPSAAEVRPK